MGTVIRITHVRYDGVDLLASSPADPKEIEPAPAVLAEPDALEMAVNFTNAMARWIEAGVPVVSQDVYEARSAACGACELWDGSVRLGLGRCKAPGCGCTKFKRWLATEVCKHPKGSKWPALQPPV